MGLHSNGKGMHEIALEDFRKELFFRRWKILMSKSQQKSKF